MRLAVVATVGLVVRILATHAFLPTDPLGDNFYFHTQANLLADGEWFQNPFRWAFEGRFEDSAIHPPLYVVVLALGSLFGVDTFAGHAYLSSLLGTITVVLVGLLARRVAGDRAGLIAAVVAAVYPNLWLHDTIVMSESLYALVIGLVLLAAIATWTEPTARNGLLLGAAIGAAALTRGEAIALVPLLLWPALLRQALLRQAHRRQAGAPRGWPAALRAAAVGTAAFAAVLVPWSAWNTVRFGEPVLVSINSEEVLAVANCPDTYSGDLLGYWTPNCYRGEPTGNEAQRGTYWRELGLEYIGDHLGELPKVVGARVGGALGVFRPFLHVRFGSYEGRDYEWGLAGLWTYWALTPLAAMGALTLRSRRVAVWPLLAPFVMILAVSALIYGAIRFRIAWEVPLVVLAAVTVDRWLPRRTTGPRDGSPEGAPR